MIAAEPLPPHVVVGRGRLGRALSEALRRLGPPPRSVGGREALARPGLVLPDPPVAAAEAVVLLAVRDDALAGLAAALARSAPAPTVAILHHSGALGLDVLAPLERAGFAVGSCHPLQSFTGAADDAARFAGAAFAVDGTGVGRRAAERLARALGGRPVAVPAGARDLYHLAASLGANGLTGLVGASLDALGAAGLDPDDALRALGPLLRTSLEEALRLGPAAALTGPASRGDEATLARHRAAVLAWDASRTALLEALVAEQRRLAVRARAAADARMPRSD